MTSSRPYLIRALYEWIVDNAMTPHLLVDANGADVQVPSGHAQDGQIVLNVAPSAVQGLVMNNEHVAFHARFGGAPFAIHVPCNAVLGVYARENGQGMLFTQEDGDGDDPGPQEGPGKPRGKPVLKVVR